MCSHSITERFAHRGCAYTTHQWQRKALCVHTMMCVATSVSERLWQWERLQAAPHSQSLALQQEKFWHGRQSQERVLESFPAAEDGLQQQDTTLLKTAVYTGRHCLREQRSTLSTYSDPSGIYLLNSPKPCLTIDTAIYTHARGTVCVGTLHAT